MLAKSLIHTFFNGGDFKYCVDSLTRRERSEMRGDTQSDFFQASETVILNFTELM